MEDRVTKLTALLPYSRLYPALLPDLARRLGPRARLDGLALRMRGLPYNATAADVMRFFSPTPVLGGATCVFFACTIEGRPTGEAFCEVMMLQRHCVRLPVGPHSYSLAVGQLHMNVGWVLCR